MFLYFILGAIAIWLLCVFIRARFKRIRKTRWLWGDNQLKVNDKEFREIPSLVQDLICANTYCKRQTIILYIHIKRQFPSEVEARKQVILSLCEIMTLRELDYDSEYSGDLSEYEDLLSFPAIYKAIEVQSREVVRKITGKEDQSFYNTHNDAWEIRYAHLEEAFDIEQIDRFYTDVCYLAEVNNGRVTVERQIYLYAHRFLVKTDREYALKLYLHYLNVRSYSETYKYRKIPARSSKVLFRQQGEQKKFDAICADLLQHKDLQKALGEFGRLQITQRKKIALNTQAIKAAAEKQTKVAGMLTELLADEEEMPIPTQQITKTEIPPSPELPSTDHKEALFQLFINHSFKVNKEEVNIFARPRGIFTSQFVESINEEHYEELDDVLIEEDNDYYIMSEPYFQQIRENGD